MKDKFLIIVTGKSGSGKSTFSSELSKILDAELIDFDNVSHQSLENEKIKKYLLSMFGDGIFENGKINRKALGKIVFNSKEKLKILNEICQKFIEDSVDEKIKTATKKYIILEYALLEQMKYFDLSDLKILITADDDTRHSRIILRDNISREYLKSREQHSPIFNTEIYDEIIDNNSNLIDNLSLVAEKIAKKIYKHQ